MSKLPPTPALYSPQKISRRSLLKAGMVLGMAFHTTTGTRQGNAQPRVPGPDRLWTPPQTEGPFYPMHQQADKDVDLTRVEGRSQAAKGEVVHVQGRVLDTTGNVLSGAFVEIWQANTWGRYRHKRDPNTAALDPDFQGWGQTITGAGGQYGFKTIVPGAYPAGPDWTRPPHIHFKVAKQGYYPLTTQMYFPGHKLNQADLILQNLPPAQRDMVIARQTGNDRSEEPVFVFDIVLRRVSRQEG